MALLEPSGLCTHRAINAGSTPNDDEEAEEESAQVRVEEMVSRHLREHNPDGLLRAFSEAATNLNTSSQ
jgi:hypothetical protein